MSMVSLKHIDLSSNPIRSIPAISIMNPNLRKLILKDCPIENVNELEVVKWIILKEIEEKNVEDIGNVIKDEVMIGMQLGDHHELDASVEEGRDDDDNVLPAPPKNIIEEHKEGENDW